MPPLSNPLSQPIMESVYDFLVSLVIMSLKFFILLATGLFGFLISIPNAIPAVLIKTLYKLLDTMYHLVYKLPWQTDCLLSILVILICTYIPVATFCYWTLEWRPYLEGVWWALKGRKMQMTYHCMNFMDWAKDRDIFENAPTKRLCYCKGEERGVDMVHKLGDWRNVIKILVFIILLLILLRIAHVIYRFFYPAHKIDPAPTAQSLNASSSTGTDIEQQDKAEGTQEAGLVGDSTLDSRTDAHQAPLTSSRHPNHSLFSKPASHAIDADAAFSTAPNEDHEITTTGYTTSLPRPDEECLAEPNEQLHLAPIEEDEVTLQHAKKLKIANATISEHVTTIARKDSIIAGLRDRIKAISKEQDTQDASTAQHDKEIEILKKQHLSKIARLEKGHSERVKSLKQHHSERVEEIKTIYGRRKPWGVSYFKLVEDPEQLDVALRNENATLVAEKERFAAKASLCNDDWSELWSEYCELQERLSQVENEQIEIQKLTAEITALKKELSKEKRAARVSKLASASAPAMESASAPAMESASAPAIESASTSEEQIKALLSSVEGQRIYNECLSKDLARSQESEALGKSLIDAGTLREQVVTLQATNKTMTENLNSVTASNRDMTAQHAALQGKYSESQNEATKLKREIEILMPSILTEEQKEEISGWKEQALQFPATQSKLAEARTNVENLNLRLQQMEIPPSSRFLSEEELRQVADFKQQAENMPALQEQCNLAHNEVNQLKQEVATLGNSLNIWKTQANAFQEQNIDLRKQLLAANNDIDRVTNNKESLVGELNTAHKTALTQDRVIANLRCDYRNAEVALTTVRRELEAQSDTLDERMTEIRDLQKRLSDCEEHRKSGREADDMDEDGEEDENDMSKDELIEDLQAENVKAAVKVKELEVEVAMCRETIDAKTSESLGWQEKSIEYQIERDEEAQRADELETHNKALKALESKCDGLRKRVQSFEQADEPGGLNSLIAERDGLKMSVNALMIEGKELWQAHEALKSRLGAQEQSPRGGQQSSKSAPQDPTDQAPSENLANDQPSIAELEDKCKDLCNKNQELDGQNQQLSLEASFAQDEINDLKDSVRKITDERDNLKNQLRSLQGDISVLNSNLQKGQESLSAVENDRSKLQEDLHNGILAFTSLEQERDQLRSQISKSENDHLADGIQAMAALGVECNTLKQTITGLNERMVKLESEKEIVQQRLNKACEEGRQILHERDFEINHRKNKLEPYARHLESEIAQLKHEAPAENLDKLRHEVGELASLRKKLEKERDDASKTLDAYKIREEAIAQKEKDLRLAKNQADILKQKLEQVEGYQNKVKEVERVAANLHQENKDLKKEMNDMRRKSQLPTPGIKGNGPKPPPSMLSGADERYRRLQDQVAQLKSKNEILQKKVRKLDQASSRDDDGDEDMHDEAGAGGKRAGDGQHRLKLAPKTRASQKDLVVDRLGEVEGLIKKWEAQQAIKRDLSQEPSLRDKPIVDKADMRRLNNIIESVGTPLQLAMADAGGMDGRRTGWQRASRWLAMHLQVITDHEDVKGILVDAGNIERIVALDDRDLSMLASNMSAKLSMNVTQEDEGSVGDE